MTTAIEPMNDAQIMESVVIGGDLSRLSPAQRVMYYNRVCSSLGLNPLTKPFDYINLNGKLTLYARKDATDQLRKLHSVSIDDVEIQETDKQFIVKVKGHDREGRADVEVGVVNKTDMKGDTANAQMKAVTKGKRRLTLSLCGLGMLDETEVQTIPDARPVAVAETGEIVQTPVGYVSKENWDAHAERIAKDNDQSGNPEPIDDAAWKKWTDLCERADAFGIKHPTPSREITLRSELRAAWIELNGYVKDAAEQEAATQPTA
jgi:hypothetical protein